MQLCKSNEVKENHCGFQSKQW